MAGKKLADYSVEELQAELGRREKCMFCDNLATHACDALVGLTWDGESEPRLARFPTAKDPSSTCDAPICGSCAKMVGHICGELCETIDWCPWHVQHDPRCVPLSFDEIQSERRAIHAQIKRARFG